MIEEQYKFSGEKLGEIVMEYIHHNLRLPPGPYKYNMAIEMVNGQISSVTVTYRKREEDDREVAK